MKKLFISLVALITFSYVSLAQNTFPATGAAGIGTTTPNASSLLDITSTSKGVLIPRMTKTQRDAIVLPVEGLMIYQTNSTPGFYFYDGNSWEAIAPKGANKSLSNLTAPTSVGVDLLPASDNSVNIGSSSVSWKDANFSGNANFDGKGYFLGGLNVGSFSNQTATVEVTPSSASALRLNPYTNAIGGSTGELQMMEATANGFNYVGFKSPSSIIANKVWTLPAADGTNGQVLSTNGAGILSWVTGTGGGAESDPQVGTNTTSFVPRWDGAALSTGSIFDNGTSIGIGTASPEALLHIFPGSTEVPFLVDSYLGLPVLSVSTGITAGVSIGTSEISPEFGLRVLGQTIIGSSTLTLDGTFDLGVDEDAYFKSKVAIGTTAPNSTFHVNSPGGEDAMRIQVNGQSKLFVSSNGGVSVGSSSTPPVNGLTVTGSVGVGNASPDARLRVDALSTDIPFKVMVGGNQKLYLANNGGLAIGNATTADANGLFVYGNTKIGSSASPATLTVAGSGKSVIINGTDPYIQLQNSSTDKAYVRADGDNLLLATNSGNTAGQVILRADGTNIVFVNSNGTVGIGTGDTKGYKLGVDGSVVCEELKVKLSQNWPDYVFADDYQLPSLSEVENSIQLNKHLPGIPSAKQIDEEGINVGEMQKLMMQKIEELTLYMIELKKENRDLKSEVSLLRSTIK